MWYATWSDILLRNTFRPKILRSQFIHESFPFLGWKFRFNTWLKDKDEDKDKCKCLNTWLKDKDEDKDKYKCF